MFCLSQDGNKDLMSSSESDGRLSPVLPNVAKQVQLGLQMTTKRIKGKRVWDKKKYCLYCDQPYPKLARHLCQKHSTEIEVAAASALKLKSKERRAAFQHLSNKGNFAHNKQVLTEGRGNVIVVRRPEAGATANCSSYVPCQHCFGFFYKEDLWRHSKQCKAKSKSVISQTGRKQHQRAASALLPTSVTTTKVFKENILDKLSADAVSMAVRNDKDIVKFGTKLFTKVARDVHQYSYVRQKVRELGRFLIQVRKKGYGSLRDCIKPSTFPDVVTAVQETCIYDEATFTYKNPSLAIRLWLFKYTENLPRWPQY
jgi:hypothetical protein